MNPIWKTTHVMRITPHSGKLGQRSGGLRDAQAGERNPASRKREAHRLDQRMCGRPPDDAPPARRCGELGEPVIDAEEAAGDEVAGHGEVPHPAHTHRHPCQAERCPEAETHQPTGVPSEADLEQGDADERQRPPTPRRERQRDQEPAAESEREPTQAASSRCTTMRCRVDPGGWHANRVPVWAGSGRRSRRRRVRRPPCSARGTCADPSRC